MGVSGVDDPHLQEVHEVPGVLVHVIGVDVGDPLHEVRQRFVARLDDEVTVKRYRQTGTVVSLLPENEDFEPIEVDLKTQSLVIEGVVVGVIRDGLLLH